jgi:hypothetical protein
MKLEKIEERLTLFPEWLAYWLTERYRYNIMLDTFALRGSPEYIMKMFNKTGMLVMGSHEVSPGPLNFDQWLFKNGHIELLQNLN